MGALRVLCTGVTCGMRDGARVIAAVFRGFGAIVDVALLSPAEPASQEAMRVLCLLTRGYPPGYQICSTSSETDQAVGSAAAAFDGSGVGASQAGRHRAGPAHASDGSGVDASCDGGSGPGPAPAPDIPADLAPGTANELAGQGPGSVGSGSPHIAGSADVWEGRGAVPSGAGAETEAALSTAHDEPAGQSLETLGEVARDAPAERGPLGDPAEVAPDAPADGPADAPADVPADTPADAPADAPAEGATPVPGEAAPGTPADGAPPVPAEVAPGAPADGAPTVPDELVRLGAARAAVAHLNRFITASAAQHADGARERAGRTQGVSGAGHLTRSDVATFLCWIVTVDGVLADLDATGGLQILVGLTRSGEGVERRQAITAVAVLALSNPAAHVPLRKAGAITQLAQHFEVRIIDVCLCVSMCVKSPFCFKSKWPSNLRGSCEWCMCAWWSPWHL